MALIFRWSTDKASDNRRKHGIEFEEAATVFADPLSTTIPDPKHSRQEDRFVMLGTSAGGQLLVVVFAETEEVSSGLSVPGERLGVRGLRMKKEHKRRANGDMLREYEFRGGVRGKYARQYARGSNVIVLSPDLAEIFPDSQSVDRALRALVQIARRTARRSA